MPPMEALVAVAKARKYATSESGDTLEMIERPTGGPSPTRADGEASGKATKKRAASPCACPSRGKGSRLREQR